MDIEDIFHAVEFWPSFKRCKMLSKPLLFIIDVNDMCNISDKLKFILFADDTDDVKVT